MKSLMIAAVVAFATAANLSPASAAGPRASSSNTIPQAAVTTVTPHYEWQSGYVGHHPRYEGRWVLVQ